MWREPSIPLAEAETLVRFMQARRQAHAPERARAPAPVLVNAHGVVDETRIACDDARLSLAPLRHLRHNGHSARAPANMNTSCAKSWQTHYQQRQQATPTQAVRCNLHEY
eukprot:6173424-Pleurochrysis_carterae.AAC.1